VNKQCMRAIRREGLAVFPPYRCARCGNGPCVDMKNLSVPNRLFGVTILENGDAA
jgi:hypothetical protein